MNKLILTLAISIILAASSAKSAERKIIKQHLDWVGCGITKKAFMRPLSESYAKKTGIKIRVVDGSSSEGIRLVKSMAADMGGACRHKLRGNEEEKGVRLVPIAWDALAIISNKNNPVKNISLGQLRAVFEGRLTHWSQLGGADHPIKLLMRNDKASGVGHSLRHLLFKDENKEILAKRSVSSSGSLESMVESMPFALAVSGFSKANRHNVNIMQLEGYMPSYNSIQDGSYPLHIPLYITLNVYSENVAEVKQFINFALGHEGRAVIRGAGAVPYFEALALIRKTGPQRMGKIL